VWFGVVTLFPEIFTALQSGITGRAIEEKLIHIACFNPRDYTQNKYRNVDDRPYGGGPGMIMMTQPLRDAIHTAKESAPASPAVIYLSPQGKMFNQKTAEEWITKKNIVFVAGRYEGIDERILQTEIDEEWSIGNYVLSGGEFAALVMIDAMTRLLPDALGHKDSAAKDSLSSGLLKYPQYTRPEVLEGLAVPDVLLSGNHAAIERWRLKQSLGKTWLKRPDLLQEKKLTKDELNLLMEFVEEQKNGKCNSSN